MQGIEIRGLNELDARLGQILKDIPEARKRMHERISDALRPEVRAAMDASGLGAGGGGRKWHSSPGSVRSWQQGYVGSGGGYAAVRPEASSTGANSPGAITNYLENGHAARLPSGSAKRQQKSRRKMASVMGYHFYNAARAKATAIATGEASAFADELARKVEG